jgi:hypothetical protein
LMMDRLNTKDMMQRKQWKIDSGPECILCSSHMLETIHHLFLERLFAMSCWNMLDIQWDFSLPIPCRVLKASTL